MPFEADWNVWGALVGACRVHGEVEVGRWSGREVVGAEAGARGGRRGCSTRRSGRSEKALEEGKPMPTELRNEETALRKEMIRQQELKLVFPNAQRMNRGGQD
ncbi:putative pentatricopeptide repeat-containing protein [Acorus calamus]|uniref:Pentatricopeptide repeat-containing protein n=1 Tax=Acorus calamus TaxID=4465 RepID=A0AAV9D145_ACOCL|nr:putative pentatricopeptide repeat-containing protein [Acorus calamus]